MKIGLTRKMSIEIYVLMALAAATLLGVSTPLQSKGIKKVPDLSPDWWIKDGKIQWGEIKEVIKILINKYIFVAVFLAVGGGVLNMMALARGQATIVQPLMTFGNFVTVILGVVWLGESLDKIEYFEIALVLVGILFLSWATGG